MRIDLFLSDGIKNPDFMEQRLRFLPGSLILLYPVSSSQSLHLSLTVEWSSPCLLLSWINVMYQCHVILLVLPVQAEQGSTHCYTEKSWPRDCCSPLYFDYIIKRLCIYRGSRPIRLTFTIPSCWGLSLTCGVLGGSVSPVFILYWPSQDKHKSPHHHHIYNFFEL